MNKYLLKFNKMGNMRFISHLDLNRLFRRAMKKAEIRVAYSNGYNPHEKMSVIQPLSLGFESECEYFEITTLIPYEPKDLVFGLNASMPSGICFYDCREVSLSVGNLSNLSDSAVYEVLILMDNFEYDSIDIDSFLGRPEIKLLKRDKKTKTMVEKDYKNYIYGIKKLSYEDGNGYFEMHVKCATNETLNPANLANALLSYFDIEPCLEHIFIKRLEIMKENGESLYLI